MIEIDFFYPQDLGQPLAFQLIRFAREEPWDIVLHGELLGRIEKKDGHWRGCFSNDLPDNFILLAGQLIDAQHYNQLPSQIKDRWAKQVAEVITESDRAYMVVCKPEINFLAFKGIFSRFVPGLLKDEWAVKFKVFSHDFNQDFELLVSRPLKESRLSY
jgi:hypothetical protein